MIKGLAVLIKSRVRAHSRHSPQGTLEFIKEHERKVTPRPKWFKPGLLYGGITEPPGKPPKPWLYWKTKELKGTIYGGWAIDRVKRDEMQKKAIEERKAAGIVSGEDLTWDEWRDWKNRPNILRKYYPALMNMVDELGFVEFGVSIGGVPKPITMKRLTSALTEIAKVLNLKELANHRGLKMKMVEELPGRRVSGSYSSMEREISIRKSPNSLAHEFGHFIDEMAGVADGRPMKEGLLALYGKDFYNAHYASFISESPINQFVGKLVDTDSYRRLVDETYRTGLSPFYLRNPSEIFARYFDQYIALRSADGKAVRGGKMLAREQEFGMKWTAKEVMALAPEFKKILNSIHWFGEHEQGHGELQNKKLILVKSAQAILVLVKSLVKTHERQVKSGKTIQVKEHFRHGIKHERLAKPDKHNGKYLYKKILPLTRKGLGEGDAKEYGVEIIDASITDKIDLGVRFTDMYQIVRSPRSLTKKEMEGLGVRPVLRPRKLNVEEIGAIRLMPTDPQDSSTWGMISPSFHIKGGWRLTNFGAKSPEVWGHVDYETFQGALDAARERGLKPTRIMRYADYRKSVEYELLCKAAKGAQKPVHKYVKRVWKGNRWIYTYTKTKHRNHGSKFLGSKTTHTLDVQPESVRAGHRPSAAYSEARRYHRAELKKTTKTKIMAGEPYKSEQAANGITVQYYRDHPNGLKQILIMPSGNKQYIYDPKFVKKRNREKFQRALNLGRQLPQILKEAEKDVGRKQLDRTRVLASITLLIDRCKFRIGNPESAEEGVFGLSTIQNRHVKTNGAVEFSYVGKYRVSQQKSVVDPVLGNTIKELKGQCKTDEDPLFRYREGGELKQVTAAEVNNYLHRWGVTTKDFRTFHASRLVYQKLREMAEKTRTPANPKDFKRLVKSEVKTAVEFTAGELGHSPGVCKKSYIMPQLLERYMKDRTLGTRTPLRKAAGESKDFFKPTADELEFIRWLEEQDEHQGQGGAEGTEAETTGGTRRS